MKNVTLLKQHDYREWLLGASGAGWLGPYGVEHLGCHNFRLEWSDASYGNFYRVAGMRRFQALVDRKLGRGSAQALASTFKLRRADLALTIYEDSAEAFLRLSQLGVPPFSSVPVVVMNCWLTENIDCLGDPEIKRLRKLYAKAAKIIVLSRNQIPMLASLLNRDRQDIVFCPLGIDTEFFSGSTPVNLANFDVLAVGRDRSRDYRTFFEATRSLDIRTAVVCGDKNLEGLHVPDNCEVFKNVDHFQYRALVQQSKVVATITHAPAYPAGQTVYLEAMAAGVANIVTASPAHDDYILHRQNALTVPPRDPDAVSTSIQQILNDNFLRLQLGARAKAQVLAHNDQSNMWDSVSNVLRSVSVGVDERTA